MESESTVPAGGKERRPRVPDYMVALARLKGPDTLVEEWQLVERGFNEDLKWAYLEGAWLRLPPLPPPPPALASDDKTSRILNDQ